MNGKTATMKKVIILLLLIPNMLLASENYNEYHLDGSENIKLAIKSLTHKSSNSSIVFVHGTGESKERYLDFAKPFYRQGYDVFLYDQRGHGYSSRFTKDPSKVSTDSFNRQVRDLELIVEHARRTKEHKVYLIGHSMGSLIITRYLELNPTTVEKASLSSPMIKIKLPAPEAIVKGIADAHCFFGLGDMRVYGEDPNFPVNASHLDIKETHSLESHLSYKEKVKAHPRDLFTWGVTFKWLSEAIATGKTVRREHKKLKTPLLILSAGDDHFVDTKAQLEFCSKLDKCTIKVYKDSYHSVFLEEENISSDARGRTLAFFKDKN